ncbi:hypothetical protein HK405_008224 [Cladochytrium tenue]|nr:hypothetical protein HK405_008224 [Cladochytrium tenue]
MRSFAAAAVAALVVVSVSTPSFVAADNTTTIVQQTISALPNCDINCILAAANATNVTDITFDTINSVCADPSFFVTNVTTCASTKCNSTEVASVTALANGLATECLILNDTNGSSSATASATASASSSSASKLTVSAAKPAKAHTYSLAGALLAAVASFALL